MNELPESRKVLDRRTLVRDVAVFQFKLIVDGLRDLVLVPVSFIAGVISLLATKDGEPGPQFYDLLDGGDPSTGYAVNPVTGAPYTPQMVPRGDYARVLAEFWADGPDSETPPGHWFVILNEVNDHPELVKRFGGAGPELGPLEWDVKAYFALGGAMHDSAIAAWGIKGWYDYIRPLSAIRAMADLGQSTDPDLWSEFRREPAQVSRGRHSPGAGLYRTRRAGGPPGGRRR